MSDHSASWSSSTFVIPWHESGHLGRLVCGAIVTDSYRSLVQSFLFFFVRSSYAKLVKLWPQPQTMGSKKHKKHKRERIEDERYPTATIGEKPPSLKLILKVGNCGTPESPGYESPNPTTTASTTTSTTGATLLTDHPAATLAAAMPNAGAAAMLSHRYQGMEYSLAPTESEYDRYMGHKKLKKKKKKKDKRHKHHKEKKRRREESSQESVGDAADAEDGVVPTTPAPVSGPTPIPMVATVTTPVVPETAKKQPPLEAAAAGPGSGLSPHREPRTCVLRKIAERTPLQRLLEHLLRSLEKRDPQQFFAWPVTDNIAPGYSQIIANPMDFSTIKQKIDENAYRNLTEFVDDFKLMCDNATTYNHPDTIYFKAAKKLLHVGLKMITPEKLAQLRPVLTYMRDISRDELGFDLGLEDPENLDGPILTEEQIEKEREREERHEEEAEELRKENRRKIRLAGLGKFEAIPDDMTPEEILSQARGAAKTAADKLTLKRLDSKMGFLRQKKDGTTSLQIIVPGDGVIPGTNQRPVSLGQLIGKLNHGTGALAGFREDRRNMSKPVKPLYYGAFGSYAPSYDSTFANLTKDETDLVYQTYGDETAVQYAESILDFAKDCDYTLTMVDDLLDILTGGDHRKTKKLLEEKRRLREEEEKIEHLLEKPPRDADRNQKLDKVKVDVDQLKTLSEFGIDVNFLDNIEEELKLSEERLALQNRLDDTSQMLGRLRRAQHDRLSAPPPAHLSNVPKPQESEMMLAEKITESLADIAKKLPPSAIAPIDGLRRAMGIATVGAQEPMDVDPVPSTDGSALTPRTDRVTQNLMTTQSPPSVRGADLLATAGAPGSSVAAGPQGQQQIGMAAPGQQSVSMQMGLGHDQSNPLLGPEATSVAVPVVVSVPVPVPVVPDLESELREFLESDPTLGHSPLHDDKTLEDILSES
ncbi:bromodomain-containing protein 7 isoform X2 [Orussus abietinus]|uniref:bromodomain-containing protein 7 isoform X2 n=1 Tax=Orussus abietinus TaxID=222816 RepID=UPI000626D9A1|nr:bromodomain-containing protein 7 isoform X2 [Orussus abietinus]